MANPKAPGNDLFNDILKEYYGSAQIEKQYNDMNIFYKDIQKTSAFIDAGGKFSVRPLEASGQSQTGSRAMGNNALPRASKSNYKSAIINLVKHYGRIEIEGELMKLANGGAESFVDIFTERMSGQMATNIKDYNVQLLRSNTGEIGKVNGAVNASVSVVVDDLVGLRPNMVVDIYNGATKQADSVTISDITESTKTLTMDTAVTVADNAIIVQEDNYNGAMTGLTDVFSTTNTYFTIDRTAAGNGYFQGKVLTTSQNVITDSILTRMKSSARVAGVEPKYWLCSEEVADSVYTKLLLPDKRNNEATIDGGYKTFTYHNIPFLREPDDVKGRLALMTPSLLEIHTGTGFEWANDDGSILHNISGYDAYEGFTRNYSNLFCKRPNAIPVITGITTDYTL